MRNLTTSNTIYIRARTNCDEPWINGLIVKKPCEEFFLDRGVTEWGFEGTDSEPSDIMYMEWSDVYLWNGEDENHDMEFFELAGVVDIYPEIEDDAPDGYEFELLEVTLCKEETWHK